MNNNLLKLSDIIYKEVGYYKKPKNEENLKEGFERVPKLYTSFRNFCLAIWQMYQDGEKEYKGLDIAWAIEYAKKYKKKEIKTILHQLNINGNTDKIILVGSKQPKIEAGNSEQLN